MEIVKCIVLFVLVLIFSCMIGNAQENNSPVANIQSVVIDKNARFTLLTPRMIRMEYDSTGKFTDEASLLVINRNLPLVSFTQENQGDTLILKTDILELRYISGSGQFNASNLKISFRDKSGVNTWKPGMKNVQNLLGTYRTLDEMNGNINSRDKKPLILEDGILSRDGWYVIDDSNNFLFDNSDWKWVKSRDHAQQDLYFMGYGTNYKAALFDYTQIAGKVPLPPRFAFGYWWSRYWNYSDAEIQDLIHKFERYQVPLDVLVIDMDWHTTDGLSFRSQAAKQDVFGQRMGWTGYTWNTSLFPDPDKFLTWTKHKELKITLNLHPASGIASSEIKYDAFAKAMNFDTTGHSNIPFEAADKKFIENWFSIILHPLEQKGIDFWWLDWQQWKNSKKLPGLSNTWWLNYLFFTDMQRLGKHRPLLYHRWGGLGNHRYQIGFSGDAVISWNSLDFQPYFTATASNVLYGYWSHDLGGHMFGNVPDSQKKINPELYTRWMQYGVFSPIFRTHSSKDPRLNKELWNFTGEYFDALSDAINLRYALAPYIYTMARKTYDTGISICRPLYYDYPDKQFAYDFKNEYMFGDNLLVMPVTTPRDSIFSTVRVWLPNGNNWYEWHTGTMLKGGQTIERKFLLNEIPVYVKSGAIIPMYSSLKNLQHQEKELVLRVFPGDDFAGKLYEDGGEDELYKTNAYTTTTFSTVKLQDGSLHLTVQPREGSFSTMITERNLEVQFYGSEVPSRVLVNGKDIPYATEKTDKTWNFSGKDLTTHIYLDGMNCQQKLEIAIFHDNITAETDGVIGKMNRIREATLYLKNHWFDGSPLPDLIPSTDQAWLTITYHPESFDKVIKEFNRNYERIPEIINTTHVDSLTKTKCAAFFK